MDDQNRYKFAMPAPTAIKPTPIPDLMQVLTQRLPYELAERILDESSGNDTEKLIQSKWEPEDESSWSYFGSIDMSGRLSYSEDLGRFTANDNRSFSYNSIYKVFASTDLLYRTLCFFPGIKRGEIDGYKCIFSVCLKHKETGYSVNFSEHKAAASFYCSVNPRTVVTSLFVDDLVELLNAYLDCTDFYHPCATVLTNADANQQPYIVEPIFVQDRGTRDVWEHQRKLVAEFFFDYSFSKDGVPLAKKVDEMVDLDYLYENVPLKQCISSSLLLYVLYSFYYIQENPKIEEGGNVIGVWSVFLKHKSTGKAVVFMDDYGLAKVKVSKEFCGNEKAHNDLKALLDFVCSGQSQHPYDGVINGSVA